MFLELSIEDRFHVFELEGADGRALEAVGVGGEHGVEGCVIVRGFVHVLNFVEEERKVTGDGAIESGLEICGPVLKQMGKVMTQLHILALSSRCALHRGLIIQ